MTTLSRLMSHFAAMGERLFLHPLEQARLVDDLAAARIGATQTVPVRVRLQVGTHKARTVTAAYLDDPATAHAEVAQALRKLAGEIEAPETAWALVPAAPEEDDAPAVVEVEVSDVDGETGPVTTWTEPADDTEEQTR
ncbi:hypothetical protein ACOQFV_27455 [Nocardiopsis changdeensis]|uniref:Uncharacterized protein n=1 Tax=Nocardiopsis changdeensis TaxID=2831969 RepID=A0ABX8BMT0_9ACTN|nr:MULTISPECIES: hypothetical protein [Nocardiopsis]QUX23005.1 hypothetical protein KGD84_00915 [Nocardiopsis changdeensis]QYX38948.1 hypothetical protein K1J57_10365 [Nocardiopsis sp. MT53]